MTKSMQIKMIKCFMIDLYETFLHILENILVVLLYLKEKFIGFTVPSLFYRMPSCQETGSTAAVNITNNIDLLLYISVHF